MRCLIITTIIFFCCSCQVLAQDGKAWIELLENKPDVAKEMFGEESNSETLNQKLERFEGLYQSKLMLGEMKEAYTALRRMVELATGNSLQGLFLLRLGFEAERTGMVEDYHKFINDLVIQNKSKIDAYTRTVLALIRNRLFLQQNDIEAARNELAESTRIQTISRVAGPVYIPQKYGVDLPTVLEQNLLSPEYEVHDNIKVNVEGTVRLSSILANDSKSAVAYLYLTVNSETARKVVFDMVSNSLVKIWVNGRIVNSPALYHNGSVSERNSRVIDFYAGKNLILIKAMRKDVLQLGLRDFRTGGKLNGVEVLPFLEADWAQAKLNNFSGKIFSKIYQPPFLKELDSSESIAGKLWKSFYYRYTKNFEKGIELHNTFLKQYPQSALLLYVAGDFYKNYYNYYESKQRALVQCENYMRLSLQEMPGYILPKFVLSQLLLANKQDALALKLAKEIGAEQRQFPWVHNMLSKIYSSKGWTFLAQEEMEKYYAADANNIFSIIDFYLGLEEFEKAEKLFKKAVSEKRISKYAEFNLLVRLNKVTAAKIALAEWYAIYPQEKNAYFASIIDLAYMGGKYKSVDKYLHLKLLKNPNDAGTKLALAKNTLRMGELNNALVWFDRAHVTGIEYGPSMFMLPERIEVDSGKEFELEKYDLSLDKIDTAQINKESYERASFANVIRVKVQKIYVDLSSEDYTHQALKIFDTEGVSQLAELNTGDGTIIKCRTISPTGEEFIPESSENLSLNKAISMYNVAVGSTLEFSTRYVTEKKEVFEEQFDFVDFNNPIIHSRYALILPRSILSRLSIEEIGNVPEPTVEIKGDDVLLQWDGAVAQGIEPEAYMPKDLEAISKIRVKIYSNELENPGIIAYMSPLLTTMEINNLAQDLCKGLVGTEAKASAIYIWIAKNIQNNQYAKSARDAFALRAGTVQAKMLLMQGMLKAVGVEAYPVVCNIPFSVAGALLSEDRVNSMGEFSWPLLLRIINEDKRKADLWTQISNDMQNSRLSNIGKLSIGALSLERSPVGVRLGTVREDMMEGVRVLDPDIVINEDGSAAVAGGVEFYGSSAIEARKVFYNSEHARQYVAQIASQLFPRITNTSYSYPTPQNLEADIGNEKQSLILSCNGTVLNYCSKRGEELYFNPLIQGKFVRDLIVKQPRKYPVDIRMDIENVISKSFTIPQGYVYKNVPRDRVIRSSFGLFILDYRVVGRELKVSGSILIPAQLIAPEDTEIYNKFLAEVTAAVGGGIAIVKMENNFGVEVIDEGVLQPEIAGRYNKKYLPGKIRELVAGDEK